MHYFCSQIFGQNKSQGPTPPQIPTPQACGGAKHRVLGTELQTHQALTKLFNEEWPLPTGVVKTSNFSLRSTLGKGLYP